MADNSPGWMSVGFTEGGGQSGSAEPDCHSSELRGNRRWIAGIKRLDVRRRSPLSPPRRGCADRTQTPAITGCFPLPVLDLWLHGSGRALLFVSVRLRSGCLTGSSSLLNRGSSANEPFTAMDNIYAPER